MLKVKKLSNPTKIIKLVEHGDKSEPHVGLVNEDLKSLREVYLNGSLIAINAVGNDGGQEFAHNVMKAIRKGNDELLEELLPGSLEDDEFIANITDPDYEGYFSVSYPRMKPVDGVDYETVEREIA